MRIRDGAAVVVEGVDSAGKSTLIGDLLADARWSPAPASLHLPSGSSPLTGRVYDALESIAPTSGLARQLFHLACHAENASTIAQRRQDGGLLLDRWWWSTLAYSTDLPAEQQSVIAGVAESIWSGFEADLVCCLFQPLREDPNNSELVAAAYHQLAEDHDGPVLFVPPASRSERVETVVDAMRHEGLLVI